MLFALYCVDYPDKTDLRLATRVMHMDYVAASGSLVKAAGPLLADDGETMVGTLIVIDVPNRGAAESWLRQDPYVKAGLFERAEIRPWRWTYGAPSGV